jgi:hypothetical protein
MKITSMESQSTQEIQSSTQVSHESQDDQPNNHTTEAPVTDSASVSTSSNDGKKVSREDIELVRQPIPNIYIYTHTYIFHFFFYSNFLDMGHN